MVPNNLPEDQHVIDYEKKCGSKMQPPVPQSSPPRPSTLPISEPKPVPTPVRRLSSTNDKHKRISDPQQQHQHHYQHSNGSSSSTSTSPPKNVAPNPIPRSQPISVKRSEHRSSVGSDINSISPPLFNLL